jgi:hypothetical protein
MCLSQKSIAPRFDRKSCLQSGRVGNFYWKLECVSRDIQYRTSHATLSHKEFNILTVQIGGPEHKHYPREQYCLHKDIPWGIGICDKRDILQLPLSFKPVWARYQSVLAEYVFTRYWFCFPE